MVEDASICDRPGALGPTASAFLIALAGVAFVATTISISDEAYAGKKAAVTKAAATDDSDDAEAESKSNSKPDAGAAPAAKAGKSAAWPKTLDDAKAEAEAADKPPPVWTAAEIAGAKARCAAILKRVHAIAIPQSPVRDGACGAPAPVQLIAIGSKPEVAISPPALVTCELVEGLHTWLETSLQPLARKEFGTEIIKIETMSDYSCRNAYGRAKNKLSEHGRANALDIRGFVTATAKTAYVLEGWGKPQREILAEIAAAKAAEERASAIKAKALEAEQANQMANQTPSKSKATGATGTSPIVTGTNSGAPASGLAKSTIIDGTPKLTVTIPGGRSGAEVPAFSIGPDKLGGPKEDGKKARGNVSAFLHQAHDAACQIFGTTLGPEANAAHRNHFHVDMAERKITKICD